MATRALPPVLVVDDSEDDLHLIKRLLAKSAVKNPIVTFTDVVAATAFLKAASSTPNAGLMPYLVFTDLKMPGMDGFELVKWIRGQKAFARLPVIMLSGSDQDKDIKRAKALGVTRYLVKLPNAEMLAKTIADVCG